MTIIVMLLLTLTSYAVTFGYGAKNELILKDQSCEVLQRQHQAICQWKKNLDPTFVVPAKGVCRALSNGTKALTVDACLPAFVKSYHHKKLVKSGANCWGTAMSFKGISRKPRFLWAEEMEYWLDSPVCRKLEVAEKLEPGDIINVYGPEYIFADETSAKDKGIQFWEALFPSRYTLPADVRSGYSGYHHFLHSETYLSPEISFGKDSPSLDDRFEFHPTNEIYGRPRQENSECQENQSLEPYRREYQRPPKNIRDSKCAYFTIAYRCSSIQQHLAREMKASDEEVIWQNIQKLQLEQEKLFPLQTGRLASVPAAEVRRLLKLSDTVSGRALRDLRTLPENKTRELLLTMEYFSAAGLRKTLEQARLTPPTEAL